MAYTVYVINTFAQLWDGVLESICPSICPNFCHRKFVKFVTIITFFFIFYSFVLLENKTDHIEFFLNDNCSQYSEQPLIHQYIYHLFV